MAISLERAKKLRYRETLIDSRGKRWRVNGAVKTWKRSPDRVQVPLKHGLYAHDYLDETSLDLVTLEYPDPE